MSLFIKGLLIDYIAVMDNHIHVIFVIENCDRTLGEVVRAMKYKITKIVAGGLSACLSADAVWRDLLIAENRSHGNAEKLDWNKLDI